MGVWWETTPVPQALRDAPPLERWRDPSQHPTGQTGTAQDLRVRLAVLGPAIPCLQGMGSGQCEVVRFTGMTRSLDEHLTEAGPLQAAAL